MQAVAYFSAEDLDALVHSPLIGDGPDRLVIGCPLNNVTVSVTHSHFDNDFTVFVDAPGVDKELAYTSFPANIEYKEPDDLERYVNRRVNMAVAGLMAQIPKPDAKAAAWATDEEDRQSAFAQDLVRFEQILLHEGFDRDVALQVATALANEKWDITEPLAQAHFTEEDLKEAGKKGIHVASDCGNAVAIGRYNKKTGYSVEFQYRDAMDGLPSIRIEGLTSHHIMNSMSELLFRDVQEFIDLRMQAKSKIAPDEGPGSQPK